MPRANPGPAPTSDSAGNKPVHTVRHRNIKAAVWVNETEKGPMYNVTLSRSYRDEQNEWHDSQSFGYDDLMNVAALLYEAHAFISAERAKFAATSPRPVAAASPPRRTSSGSPSSSTR